MAVMDMLCKPISLYTYQKDIARRIFFSLLIGDAEELTVLCARQSGKSEVLADVCATCLLLFPTLAKLYPNDPNIAKFRYGIMIGVFGPIESQSETIFSRIKLRLVESEHAKTVVQSPDFQDEALAPGKEIKMKRNKSFCRMQTAHPKAKIESKTYHLIILDEAQEADSTTVRQSLHPMLTATGGTIVKVGTCSPIKGDFYEAIQRNEHRGMTYEKPNNFKYDAERAAKENPFYRQSLAKEKERLGEDSDEYRMAYKLEWLFERGMLITDEQIDLLGDRTMPVIYDYTDTPIVAGLDVAKRHDSTVLTAVWVDWEHPDEFGLYPHRILNWLELHGENWESQYRQICEFLSHYRVMRLGVDAQGMGDPVAERLQVLLPSVEVLPMKMNPLDQAERWQHLLQLIQRGMLRWPAHPKVRRTMTWKRFVKQMESVEKIYQGRHLMVAAPRGERNSHDDYVDSLALACFLTKDFGAQNTVEEWSSNPFLERGLRSRA